MVVRIDEIEASVREPAGREAPQASEALPAADARPCAEERALRATLERLAERERRLWAD